MPTTTSQFIHKILYPLIFTAVLWLIEALDFFLNLGLSVYGIFPRTLKGLLGIVTGPFIHSDWGHLASNTLPILTLTTILVLFYKRVALEVIISIGLLTGLLVWLFARPAYHIGASGLVYGLISYIFWTGIFKKNPKSIVLSLIVLTLYSGSVTTMFPDTERHISWESHLFGAIVGLITAFFFKTVVEEDEKQYLESPWANSVDERTYFLPRDIFEKTRLQRYYEYLEAEQKRMDERNFLE